ncbi:MAG: hypothetical protein HY836_10515 [Aquabacterium sp.]|uniref:sensor histidine kinase n=1 Tax=Aquabacterium sp. TaxID=1872578 RepID=UPI0025C4019D|nr:ATP-binding protein [Aquabacterium sp.]MBI5926019.1 hypothetical protein [Aquabacterium sp.]
MTDTIAPTQPQERVRLILWASALVAVGALSVCLAGLSTPWDRFWVPTMGALYALVAALLWRKPAWLTPLVFGVLLLTSVYFIGGLYVASNDHSPNGLYALACAAQFMTMFYVAAFVALGRAANLLCWLHYAGLIAMYLYRYGPVMHGAEDMVGHTWGVLLAAQPACIVALHYISTLKDRLRATERASHESKERFLAMLSHEIRSPLQSILGSIDLLALKANTPPEHRAIERIRNAASQLDTHLRDVTEYTRLENPAWRLQPQAVDLALLVQDVCDAFQPQAQSHHIKLTCELPPSDSLSLQHIWADGARVRQILGNLIGNALKYTPSGSITVRASRASSTSPAHLEVIDTGIGIPPEHQERVFEPYVRLEDARITGAEGSGLGLAVVKRLADRMGAAVHLQSQPGQGSHFTVILPQQG